MSIDAMKQALYFLDRLQFDECDPEHVAAITTLRAAIEAVERQEPVAWKPTGPATEQLWEALGRWSAYIASNGSKAELAPPQYLLDAMDAFTTPQPAIPAWQPSDEHLRAIIKKCDIRDGVLMEHILRIIRVVLAAAPKPEDKP